MELSRPIWQDSRDSALSCSDPAGQCRPPRFPRCSLETSRTVQPRGYLSLLRPAGRPGPLPRGARARRLRRRPRRHDARQRRARHRRPRPHRAAQPRPPRRHRRRPARRRRRRHPHPGPRRVPPRGRRLRRCPPRGAYAVGIAFLPVDDAERAAAVEAASRRSPPRRASRSSAGATCRSRADLVGAGRPRLHAGLPPAVRRPPPSGRQVGARPRPAGVLPAQAGRARGRRLLPLAVGRAPSSTRACSPPASSSRSSPTCPTARFATELALVHSRFSTNTFPSWPLAHPYRFIAHNGEINTVKGNRNWMRARESQLTVRHHPRRPRAALPDLHARGVRLGVLRRGARAAPPRRPLAAARGADDDPRGVGEPRRRWTRPAGRSTSSTRRSWSRGTARPASRFTDGTLIGAVLDRNGLRPGRYWVTDDGLVVLASEAGVLDLDPSRVVRKRGRLQPGRMFLVDTEHGRHRQRRRDQVRARRRSTPTTSGCTPALISLDGPARARAHRAHRAPRSPGASRPSATPQEELRILLTPMARPAARRSARWAPTRPIAVLSDAAAAALRLLHPAVRPGDQPAARRDPRGARHLARHDHRPGGQRARRRRPAHARQLVLPFPVIDNDELAKIVHINADGDLPGYATHVVRGLYDVTGGAEAHARAARGDLRRGVRRRSPTAPGSSCSPTATPAATSRRSRRCCSPRRCTTT